MSIKSLTGASPVYTDCPIIDWMPSTERLLLIAKVTKIARNALFSLGLALGVAQTLCFASAGACLAGVQVLHPLSCLGLMVIAFIFNEVSKFGSLIAKQQLIYFVEHSDFQTFRTIQLRHPYLLENQGFVEEVFWWARGSAGHKFLEELFSDGDLLPRLKMGGEHGFKILDSCPPEVRLKLVKALLDSGLDVNVTNSEKVALADYALRRILEVVVKHDFYSSDTQNEISWVEVLRFIKSKNPKPIEKLEFTVAEFAQHPRASSIATMIQWGVVFKDDDHLENFRKSLEIDDNTTPEDIIVLLRNGFRFKKQERFESLMDQVCALENELLMEGEKGFVILKECPPEKRKQLLERQILNGFDIRSETNHASLSDLAINQLDKALNEGKEADESSWVEVLKLIKSHCPNGTKEYHFVVPYYRRSYRASTAIALLQWGVEFNAPGNGLTVFFDHEPTVKEVAFLKNKQFGIDENRLYNELLMKFTQTPLEIPFGEGHGVEAITICPPKSRRSFLLAHVENGLSLSGIESASLGFLISLVVESAFKALIPRKINGEPVQLDQSELYREQSWKKILLCIANQGLNCTTGTLSRPSLHYYEASSILAFIKLGQEFTNPEAFKELLLDSSIKVDDVIFLLERGFKLSFQQHKDLLMSLLENQELWNQLSRQGWASLIDTRPDYWIGSKIIHVVCQRGWDDLVRTLLISGENVNVKDLEGRSPLIYATAFGRLGTITLLLELGASVNFRDMNGSTPLFFAMNEASEHKVETAIKLLKTGADTTLKRKNLGAPIDEVASQRIIQQLDSEGHAWAKGPLFKAFLLGKSPPDLALSLKEGNDSLIKEMSLVFPQANFNFLRLGCYSVDERHLCVGQEVDFDYSNPPNIQLEALVDLYDRYASDRPWKENRPRIVQMIQLINTRGDSPGAPPEGELREDWYRKQEILLKKNIVRLQREEDLDKIRGELTEYALVGALCTPRQNETIRWQYTLGNDKSTISFKERLLALLSKFRRDIVSSIAWDYWGGEVHPYNKLLFHLGDSRAIYGGNDAPKDTLQHGKEVTEDWAKGHFDSRYTPATIVTRLLDDFSSKTGMFTRDELQAWFQDLIAPEWNKEHYDPLIEHVNSLIRTGSSQESMDEYLQSQNIETRVNKSPEGKIRQAQLDECFENFVFESNGSFRFEAVVALALKLNIIKPID